MLPVGGPSNGQRGAAGEGNVERGEVERADSGGSLHSYVQLSRTGVRFNPKVRCNPKVCFNPKVRPAASGPAPPGE